MIERSAERVDHRRGGAACRLRSATTVAPTQIAADDTDPVLALIAEEKRLEALWVAADKIRFGKSREVKVLGEQMGAIRDQIRNTKSVTIAGAIAMIELGLYCGCVDERLINAAIASLRDMSAAASPGRMMTFAS
jgi:hypothetical protein